MAGGSCSVGSGLPRAPVSRWGKLLDRLVGADLRSLAAARVAVASIVLFDLLMRARDLTAHYSDDGVLPRDAWHEYYGYGWRLSLHLLSGRPEVIAVLFGVAAVFALMLLAGYRTRLATLASFVMLASLHGRNPLVLNGGDDLLVLVLLWGAFVPWGARFSVDAALDPVGGRMPERVLSVGTAVLVLQMPIVYFFTGLLKEGPEWRSDFSAVAYTLRAEEYTTAIGKWMTILPLEFLQLVTISVLVLELAGPVLMFMPKRTALFRMPVILLFAGLQLGFGASLSVGIFPLISTAALLPLVPTEVWQRLFRPRAQAQIHYDADCGFCFKTASILATFLGAPRPKAAQNDESIYADLEKMKSWVVEHEGRRHFGWDGFVAVVRASPVHPMAEVLSLPAIVKIGRRAYRSVADRRWAGGRMLGWLEGRRVNYRLSRPLSAVCLAFFSYGMVDNLAGVGAPVQIPERMYWVGSVFHVFQDWAMFAPGPPLQTKWVMPEGRLASGERIDMLNGVPREGGKPELVSEWFPNARWRKYFANITRGDRSMHRSYATAYFCRTWNEVHDGPDHVRWVRLYEYTRPSVLEGENVAPRKTLLRRRKCAGSDESPLVSARGLTIVEETDEELARVDGASVEKSGVLGASEANEVVAASASKSVEMIKTPEAANAAEGTNARPAP